MNIGQAISKKRLDSGMSQDDLQSRTGIPRSYLSRVENGHNAPSMRVISDIANGLGMRCWELVKMAEETK